MKTTEEVRIDLPKMTKAPVKTCDLRNKKPVSDKFRLMPKFMPSLWQCITHVAWNAAEKTLFIEINETANFDAYKWFGGINKRLSESQKSSFVDLEQDSMLLVIQDEMERDVMSIKFRSPQLTQHACYLSKQENKFVDEHPSEPITHSLTLKYSDSEMIECYKEEPFMPTVNEKNQIVDTEWQSVNVG